MYEYVCMNCGKRQQIFKVGTKCEPKFCGKECLRAYRAKKKAARGAAKVNTSLSWPETPQEQCRKCRFGTDTGAIWCCGYFEIVGHTRTSLHPEGLQGPCQEYQPRKRGRRKG